MWRCRAAVYLAIATIAATMACSGSEDEISPGTGECRLTAANAKKAPAPPSCMNNRLGSLSAFGAMQATLLSSSNGQSSALRIQLGAYGTPRALSGPGFVLKNASSSKDPLIAATATLTAHKAMLGLGPNDTLLGSSGVGSTTASSVVHLRQHHLGVPVFSGGVTVDVDSNGDIRSLFNSTVPDIEQPAFPVVANATAQAALVKAHGAISAVTSGLFYRASGRTCDTADLAWRMRYEAKGEERVAWVNAITGQLVADKSASTALDARAEVKTEGSNNCDSTQTLVTGCSNACQGTGDAKNACVWSKQLWDYWGDATLHGAAARWSYDADEACMKTVIELCDTESAGLYNPLWVSPDYTTKGIIAHEFGHGLIAFACNKRILGCEMQIAAAQDAPVYEHIADMQAAAIDSPKWWIEGKNHKIRDWEDPTRVTQVGNLSARFPTDFDDYNLHSMGGDNYSYYMKWHVPSTIWSHLVYNLAHKPDMNRSQATEVVYRTLVNRMQYGADFSFTGYAHHMRQEAATMGLGAVVEQAQVEAKLWMPAEILLPYPYTRPGIVSGPFLLGPLQFDYLHVYYNEYNYNQGTDRLMVALKEPFSGTWSVVDTGLSPSTVSGAITAAYHSGGNQYFIAWPTWYGTVNYATRSDQFSGSWSSLQPVSSVSTSDDVALVASSGQVRLYYRDASTGKLRYVKWTGTAWSDPLDPPSGYDVSLNGGPTATWDGTRVQLTYLKSEETAGVIQVVLGRSDSWTNKDSFTSCFFDSQSSEHTWLTAPVSVNEGGSLYMVGPSNRLLDGHPEVQQALGTHPSGSSGWEFKDHGNLERTAHAVDAAYHNCDNRLWAVSFMGWPYSVAAVFWKKP